MSVAKAVAEARVAAVAMVKEAKENNVRAMMNILYKNKWLTARAGGLHRSRLSCLGESPTALAHRWVGLYSCV
jgi:hypothetical protein